MTLKAPFPYYGGKSRWAPLIWQHLGETPVYVEPFAGSLACLLARPWGAAAREIVTDTNGGLCNAWRALAYGDIEAVAYWADYPTIHQDLTARHAWLKQWTADHAHRLSEDPMFFDEQAAGWWLWGISLWIGGGWCSTDHERRPHVKASSGQGVSNQRNGLRGQRTHVDSTGGSGISAQRTQLRDQRPHIAGRTGGEGLSQQRTQLRDQIPLVLANSGGRGVNNQSTRLRDGMPHVKTDSSGQGISAQRIQLRDTRPYVDHKGGGRSVSAQTDSLRDGMPNIKEHPTGRGVNAQRAQLRDGMPHIADRPGGQGVSNQARIRPALLQWFTNLQTRLKEVVVLNRPWQSAVTPTLLQQTPTAPKPPVAILMDPPYRTENRSTTLYQSDLAGTSDIVADQAYEWAIDHGDKFRIAYCCHEGDYPIPKGWHAETMSFGGVKRAARKATVQDMVMFSPACEGAKEGRLF